MYLVYSIVLTIGFILLLPKFLVDAILKGKYAAGFCERLGFVPNFDSRGKPVVWIHCVSVGEANAARQLAQRIKRDFADHSIVISTTTRTGQQLARTAFGEIADLVFYFPFDWRFAVRRTLSRIKPSVVLLMETEIWMNFIRETHNNGTHLAIVNGRLSERSFKRFTYIKGFMRRVLANLDLAVMQEKADADRLIFLGTPANKVKVSGNLKFDHDLADSEMELTEQLRHRFAPSQATPLIIAASTHSPEEKWMIEAFKNLRGSFPENGPRLMIAPRHPERFAEVLALIEGSGLTWVKRSAPPSERDAAAEVILLDSIGELRSAYPLAEIVFVGGSLIPHGGQSIFEPASAGKAIVTGPHTANFDAAVKEFLNKEAMIHLPSIEESETVKVLTQTFSDLLDNTAKRDLLGRNALATMNNNRGAVVRTVEYLSPLFEAPSK